MSLLPLPFSIVIRLLLAFQLQLCYYLTKIWFLSLQICLILVLDP